MRDGAMSRDIMHSQVITCSLYALELWFQKKCVIVNYDRHKTSLPAWCRVQRTASRLEQYSVHGDVCTALCI